MLKKMTIVAFAAAGFAALAAPAAACDAPPGLTIYQYEERCRPVLTQLHRMQQRSSPYMTTYPYSHFVQSWYGMYLRRTQGGETSGRADR